MGTVTSYSSWVPSAVIGRDTLSGGDGSDLVFGDNGVVLRNSAHNDAYSTDPGNGHPDTIRGNAGNDILIGGSEADFDSVATAAGDRISGDAGDDVLIGDNGYVHRDGADVVLRVESRGVAGGVDYPRFGGDDILDSDASGAQSVESTLTERKMLFIAAVADEMTHVFNYRQRGDFYRVKHANAPHHVHKTEFLRGGHNNGAGKRQVLG